MNALFRRNYTYKLQMRSMRYSHFDQKNKEYVFHTGATLTKSSKVLRVPEVLGHVFYTLIHKDRWIGDPKPCNDLRRLM